MNLAIILSEGCGERFTPQRRDQRSCSRICRQRLYDARQRHQKASEPHGRCLDPRKASDARLRRHPHQKNSHSKSSLGPNLGRHRCLPRLAPLFTLSLWGWPVERLSPMVSKWLRASAILSIMSAVFCAIAATPDALSSSTRPARSGCVSISVRRLTSLWLRLARADLAWRSLSRSLRAASNDHRPHRTRASRLWSSTIAAATICRCRTAGYWSTHSDACQALAARGITGRVAFVCRHSGRAERRQIGSEPFTFP